MKDTQHKKGPLVARISFHKVLEKLEEIAENDIDYRADYARALLKHANNFPELREGIDDVETLKKHEALIRNLLADLFPTALTHNEIKAAAIPFFNFTFNHTARFEKILADAGMDFDITIRNFDDQQFYIFCCCLILNDYYGYHFDFSKPLFYDIPDSEGIMHYYRIMYNADFMEIIPTDKAIVDITPEDVSMLMDNFDDIAVWKEKFPEGSWLSKGFGIVSLYDATTESAISNLKGNLLINEEFDGINKENFEGIFRSIFKISDLRVGFTEVNTEDNLFKLAPFDDIKSHILKDVNEINCNAMFCSDSLDEILQDKKYLIVSDVERFLKQNPEDAGFASHLLSQNIKSCILAPIIKNGRFYGFIELVSSRAKELNSINANKLGYIMPFITDTIERYYSELQNEIDAIIQNEYTAIHHSVYWKFREEAMAHLHNRNKNEGFKEIVFREIYPLYGQIDVKGSSNARNITTEKDLARQVQKLLQLFRYIFEEEKLPFIEQHIFELENIEDQLHESLKADTEANIQNYIIGEVHPVLKHFDTTNTSVRTRINSYFAALDERVQMVYESRKDFDETLSAINKQMAALLDEKQEEAQAYFPHYYERFKTDGVEHNLYVGASISPKHPYNPLYLSNLRLWQLQVMCEMENAYYNIKPNLPYELDVTSLILVFSSPISIRFRMDEKRFDVDGTYNARYEVVKKRIDKSHIKGTQERIAQKGKITIVFTQKKEELEYRRYIQFLQHKNLLEAGIELLDVEDLQGVTGLKALRVPISYKNSQNANSAYTYDELLKELHRK
ncbi:GAF domain-containing protein [Flavobacterium rhizosphaerae]|uniref:GAF domain-containing protein n=1 Tax=Flavobacterium rhizosphaerae TaxID=3163298 RepID=A0ABW8YSF9_9FLAO